MAKPQLFPGAVLNGDVWEQADNISKTAQNCTFHYWYLEIKHQFEMIASFARPTLLKIFGIINF